MRNVAEALMIGAIYLAPIFIPAILIAFIAEDVVPYFKKRRARKNRDRMV